MQTLALNDWDASLRIVFKMSLFNIFCFFPDEKIHKNHHQPWCTRSAEVTRLKIVTRTVLSSPQNLPKNMTAKSRITSLLPQQHQRQQKQKPRAINKTKQSTTAMTHRWLSSTSILWLLFLLLPSVTALNDRCPRPEEIAPCQCRTRGPTIQVDSEYSPPFACNK